MTTSLRKLLSQFDAKGFAAKHGGTKESQSHRSFEWLYPCPRCGSSRLRYNSAKHTFICWGCKLTGDTTFLIQIFERVTEMGALEYLHRGYVGGDARIEHLDAIIQSVAVRTVASWSTLRTLPRIRWPRGVEVLGRPCAPHWRAWDYLLRVRGLDQDLIRDFGLGFGRSGRLKDYIVFPVYMDHALVYWQGRATWDPPPHLEGEARRQWVDHHKYRKTLNPTARSGSDAATAGDVVFNWDNASASEHVVICEGPIDAMKVGSHAVALFGKKATEPKIDRITRMNAMRYTVYLDRGKEEQEAAEYLARELEPFGEVFIAVPPRGHDPGSLTPEQNAEVIRRARPFRSDLLSSDLAH